MQSCISRQFIKLKVRSAIHKELLSVPVTVQSNSNIDSSIGRVQASQIDNMVQSRMAMIVAIVLLVLATVASAISEQEECLTAHNKVRAGVGVSDLVWSNELADYARRYAEKQRDQHQCAMVHSRGQYGENLFWGMGKRFSFSEAVKSWADEARDYDEQENKCAPGKVCGHYTQVVWGDTKSVGCASVACHDGATFVICSYDPPGNFVGERPFPVPRAHKHRHSTHTVREAAAATAGGDGGEELSRVDAKLCQCMLNCVQSTRASA